MDHEEIVKYLDKLEKEARAFKKQALNFSWHMRGGLSYDDAMMLGHHEIEIINEIIKDHLETTKETQLPFF